MPTEAYALCPMHLGYLMLLRNAIHLALILKLTPELIKAKVRYSQAKFMISHHPFHLQVFNLNQFKIFNCVSCQLV